MSADNTTICPECRQWNLKEYGVFHGVRPQATGTPEIHFTFELSAYSAECSNCGWEWKAIGETTQEPWKTSRVGQLQLHLLTSTRPEIETQNWQDAASVAEQADAPALGTGEETRVGSTPSARTILVCSKQCPAPTRDKEHEHPGVCVCGGYLDDVPKRIYDLLTLRTTSLRLILEGLCEEISQVSDALRTTNYQRGKQLDVIAQRLRRAAERS